jgi:transposase
MQRTYMRFREAIYLAAMRELRQLDGDLELDETMFGGHRPGKRGWGAAGKRIVFGIYKEMLWHL